jgi:multicomponent Na+:H+ antiporter subunit C
VTLIIAICVAVTFGVSIYLLLGRDLKGIAMGVFLLSHAANLSILAMSGTPVSQTTPQVQRAEDLKQPPVLNARIQAADEPLTQMVDPLPQALILTNIVIGFGVMGFLLALVVVTGRTTHTLEVQLLAEQGHPTEAMHE